MNKGQHTKQMIIEKAAVLFNIKGYSGCSMSDLMMATGLKKGGIYNHFSNKDEISIEAFKYSFAKIATEIGKIIEPAKSYRETLILILNFYREYASKPPIQSGFPILNTLVDADNTNPVLVSLARKKTERLVGRLEYFWLLTRQENQPFGNKHIIQKLSASVGQVRLNTDHFISISSPTNMDFIFDQFCSTIGASSKVREGLANEIEAILQGPYQEISLTGLVTGFNQNGVNGLIAHDVRDRLIPYTQAKELSAAWPEAQLITTKGYGHNRILVNKEVIQAINTLVA